MTSPDAAAPDPLAVDLAGLALHNPVILAAGTAGYVDEMADAMDLADVGAVVTKSITGDPREGNETWRLAELPAGMLNAIGLANVGAERFAAEHAPRAAKAGTVVIGSIAGHTVDEYERVARMFDGVDAIPAVEVNVSCPNVERGAAFGDSPEALAELLGPVRAALASTKMIVKLPPAASSSSDRPGGILPLVAAALDAGADALTLANTTPAMAIDVETRRPRLANVTGGLSGPAVHPVAVRLIHIAHRELARDRGVPIIGAGGVMTWRDAAQMILAGASAVEVGTALFADPRAPRKIARGLARWVRRQGRSSIRELVGAVDVERRGDA